MGFLQCYQLVSNVYTTPSSTQHGRVARFNKENYGQISISDNFFCYCKYFSYNTYMKEIIHSSEIQI